MTSWLRDDLKTADLSPPPRSEYRYSLMMPESPSVDSTEVPEMALRELY